MRRLHLFKSSALLLALLWWMLPLRVPSEQLPLKSYTTVDGLVSDRINCILKDSHGFLWFGTWDGISRFDGYRFDNFTTSEGLPGPSVNALLEARDGTYWAATIGGLARWDPARQPAMLAGSFEVVRLPRRRGSDSINALLQDRRGNLWVGTDAGLYSLRGGEAASAQEVPIPAAQGGDSSVSALLEDRAGSLWIGAESGLYRRDTNGRIEWVHGPDGSPRDIRSLLEDRAGRLWVGTHFAGIFRIDPREPPERRVPRPFSSPANGLSGTHVFSLLQGSDGTVWAGCYGGLTEFSPASPDSRRPRSHTMAEGLSGLGIFSLSEDGAGNLWIGTDDSGVMRLARHGFRSYDQRDGLASTRVVSLLADREGEACVYAGGRTPTDFRTDTGRLLQCYDGSRFHAVKPRISPGTHFGWGWSQVSFQDSRGEWWIPTFAGLYRFPAVPFGRLGSTLPRRVYTSATGLASDEIFRLYEDSRGDIWMSFSSSDQRVALWNRSRDSVRNFSPSDGLPVDSPISFAEDRAGAVWIGFYDGGLVRYRDGRFSLFTVEGGVPAGRIRALHVDRSGRLWVGSSGGGVGRVDHPEQPVPRFRVYTTRQNLSSNNVWSLADDRWGRIYVGTERGLDRLDPATGVVQTFTADDGLVRGVIEEILEDPRGALWFGSIQGVSRLVPELESRRARAPVRIASVLLGGRRQTLPDLGGVRVRLPDLAAGVGPLQIDYVGLDFTPGGRLRYQYRLEGADSRWGPPLAERSVVYANLRPGAYRFWVRAVGNDGSVSPEPAGVAFRILPPFWRRPWFASAALAALFVLAYVLHRTRLRDALAVERVRTRIATDLHDDVGASLSQIAILSEIARQEPDDAMPKVRQTLSRIAAVSRDVVDSLGDTVWAIDPRKDRLQDLVQRMRRFAGDLLTERQIDLRFDTSVDRSDRDLALDLRRELYLIFKEAVHNMARHSGCTRAEIELRVERASLCLRLTDNGKGFDPAAPLAGYGITSIRARVASLGGSVEVHSQRAGGPGAAGTTIAVSIPLPK